MFSPPLMQAHPTAGGIACSVHTLYLVIKCEHFAFSFDLIMLGREDTHQTIGLRTATEENHSYRVIRQPPCPL